MFIAVRKYRVRRGTGAEWTKRVQDSFVRRYVAAATGEIGVAVIWANPGRRVWFLVLSAGQHGATLPAFSFGTLPERCQDHAHVRQRGGERVPAPLGPDTDGKPDVSGLWLHDLLRVSSPVDRTGLRWRTRRAALNFSDTSMPLFAWHKLPLRLSS